MTKWVALLLLAALCLLNYTYNDTPGQDPYLITDYSRLHPVKVERVASGHEEEQLRELVKEARDKGLTISIAGQRHSQGGHTYYKDGIVADMTSYNRVLEFDPKRRTIRVQAGATWKAVQDYVNPYGLAVKVMQSQNMFTIGGSISVNAHGRDIRNGSPIKTVESFRLLKADGQIVNVSRTEHADLFPYVIGGYGLFGIILDITLTLTENEMYRMAIERTDVDRYSEYFRDQVLGNPDVKMHIARISVAPDSFLTDMYAINYAEEQSVPLQGHDKLKTREFGVTAAKLMFNLNRTSDWGKNAFWRMQERFFAMQDGTRITRNNAMRSESAFMEFHDASSNDLLQEYFVPVDQFASFVSEFRDVLHEEELNLLNITVRYVERDEEAALSYARSDMFALVCLFHAPLSDKGQERLQAGIRKVVDRVLAHQGTYYLPYAAYPSVEQFQAAYPGQASFFAKKDQIDPEHRFMNYFYMDYRGEGH
ncbi:FAD/FMN-containing dehydrogenase [Paenibacillus phyllosphaerae]|uniref:FAD/FMN-containing dehydrogenase n=1 Tax=Paenibacillus phyllosphaerae TaxID=274593 RepID=A0A7W5FQX0_9BACL|nr:FAD-binding oxidoreductase [Paenibacillus phyllosphaerae]MBB3113906.1 FAD/FMN-containing dehydrogenase [Paenibacillus phyllosphaerae]